MQTAAPLAATPRPASSPAVTTARAEFHFESEAALERACALAREQSWIASCSVDRPRRTLRVVLCPGTSAPLAAEAAPRLH
jgi:hypothetical protein